MRIGSILRAHISSYIVVLPIRSSFAASSIVNRIGSSPPVDSNRSVLSSFVAAFLIPYNWTSRSGSGEISTVCRRRQPWRYGYTPARATADLQNRRYVREEFVRVRRS
jgi:hypothetical protein